MRYFAMTVILALLLALPASLQAGEPDTLKQSLSVDQAYKAIPHNKTRFDPSTAGMEPDEKTFLDTFFGLSDLAVAERVETQAAISTKMPATGNYDEILKRLRALQVPPKLKTAHQLVTEAVDEQRQYLEGLRQGGAFDASAPLVESSHEKLVQAYGELMRLYPSENQHNQQAFYDHLCALDFK